MKKGTIARLAAAALAAMLAITTLGGAFAQTQPGYGPGGMMDGRRYGQGGTSQAYGPGMMGGQGYGPGASGPGGIEMMRGQGNMPGVTGGWGTTSAQAQPLNSLDDAKQAFERYIDGTGNPTLTLDEVMQFQSNYYAIVKDTSTGRGAFELLANPQSGAVFPEMGPNMMWNTQYGHMAGFGSGMMGGLWQPSTGQPTISADQAQQITQEWLDQNQPGSATETPDTFPGYYTLHITRDGTITGMLSVNAYTGQVWFHTWHGASTEA
jgi:hypothetical protein